MPCVGINKEKMQLSTGNYQFYYRGEFLEITLIYIYIYIYIYSFLLIQDKNWRSHAITMTGSKTSLWWNQYKTKMMYILM